MNKIQLAENKIHNILLFSNSNCSSLQDEIVTNDKSSLMIYHLNINLF